MMKLLITSTGIAILILGCASNVPGYKHVASSCYVPKAIAGMIRIRPTQEEVMAVWNALYLEELDLIESWFEDNFGNVTLNISNQFQHWEVTLSKSRNGEYFALEPDWREAKIICIG